MRHRLKKDVKIHEKNNKVNEMIIYGIVDT